MTTELSPKVQRTAKNAVKIGRDYFSVADLAEAVATWNAARDAYGWGSSDAPSCTACIDKKLYRISYNGRVWDGATGAEVPLPGRKTCAQHNADGWKDCS